MTLLSEQQAFFKFYLAKKKRVVWLHSTTEVMFANSSNFFNIVYNILYVQRQKRKSGDQ